MSGGLVFCVMLLQLIHLLFVRCPQLWRWESRNQTRIQSGSWSKHISTPRLAIHQVSWGLLGNEAENQSEDLSWCYEDFWECQAQSSKQNHPHLQHQEPQDYTYTHMCAHILTSSRAQCTLLLLRWDSDKYEIWKILLSIDDCTSVSARVSRPLKRDGGWGLAQGSVGEGEMNPFVWGCWSCSILAFDQALDNPTSQKTLGESQPKCRGNPHEH